MVDILMGNLEKKTSGRVSQSNHQSLVLEFYDGLAFYPVSID